MKNSSIYIFYCMVVVSVSEGILYLEIIVLRDSFWEDVRKRQGCGYLQAIPALLQAASTTSIIIKLCFNIL